MKPELAAKIREIEDLAIKEGLDFFPVIFEIVNRDIMLEACTYGLPRRGRHWSHGRSYSQQKIFGEMNLSKVFEIVFNNNPHYAFLMDTNTETTNIMVAAHVFGHAHMFKHNYMFESSDRSMVYRAAERASRIDDYIEEYGLEEVEHLMDMGLSISRHIDWHKGIYREKYPEKSVKMKKVERSEFDDLLNINSNSRSMKKVVTGEYLPPHPEKDLLWFLINYAPLNDWEKDILGIIREESYYFYPIVMTKIMHEGFASWAHAEIMSKYNKLSEGQFIDFCKTHSAVVQPGSANDINPYYLGFRVFTDIKKRWDDSFSSGQSKINGMEKMLQVVKEENDASFLRNYLTKELADDLGLFNFGYKRKRKPNMSKKDLTESHKMIELKDRDLDKIIDNIVKPTVNYGVPLIKIIDTDGDTLVLEHDDSVSPLETKHTAKTMGYLYELWGAPVELSSYNHEREKVVYFFDESGFDVHKEKK